jgi:hypothetical protein
MEIKKTTSFSYHIEQKAGGGFIARPDDPQMETIEGATEQEVEQKIGAKMTEFIGQQMPFGLGKKLIDMAFTKSDFAYHIEEKPGGGFIARPKDANHEPLEGATRQEVEEKIRGALQTLLGAQLAGADKASGLTVTRKVNLGDHTTFQFSTYSAGQSAKQNPQQPGLAAGIDPMGPIEPEKDHSSLLLGILLGLLGVAALVYVFFFRR